MQASSVVSKFSSKQVQFFTCDVHVNTSPAGSISVLFVLILPALKKSSKRRQKFEHVHVCLSNVNFVIYSSSTEFLRLASEMFLSYEGPISSLGLAHVLVKMILY